MVMSPSRGRHLRRLLARSSLLALCSVGLLGACSPPPVSPSASGFVGQWTGTISGGVAGTSVLVIRVTSEHGVSPFTRLAGDWQVMSPDPRLSGSGTFTGGQTSSVDVALDFSPMTVVCPGQAEGVASKMLLVTLVRSDQRMAGRYVALDCPGGEIAVNRP